VYRPAGPGLAAAERYRREWGDGVTSVLVVDDDPDVCDLVTYKLEQSGFDVRRASDGDAALREVAKKVPDLVLLDVMMPGVSGLEVLERWRSDETTAGMPVIMLTAKAQENDVERGFELGADDYVIKPFSPRELVRRVTAVLSRRQSV
jgi:DNA-binding response OmpR family regulator